MNTIKKEEVVQCMEPVAHLVGVLSYCENKSIASNITDNYYATAKIPKLDITKEQSAEEVKTFIKAHLLHILDFYFKES